jgi:hypothetical protein
MKNPATDELPPGSGGTEAKASISNHKVPQLHQKVKPLFVEARLTVSS